ncbi:MAG: methyl-accepting chemotaxis protein [Defluviitaleaceae bacterium]|nr:methyl-accepting chemotaxis protein [Defluviitaleaceae bacterium]
MKNFKIRTKILLSFGLMILLIFAFSIFVELSNLSINESAKKMRSEVQIQTLGTRLVDYFSQVNAGVNIINFSFDGQVIDDILDDIESCAKVIGEMENYINENASLAFLKGDVDAVAGNISAWEKNIKQILALNDELNILIDDANKNQRKLTGLSMNIFDYQIELLTEEASQEIEDSARLRRVSRIEQGVDISNRLNQIGSSFEVMFKSLDISRIGENMAFFDETVEVLTEFHAGSALQYNIDTAAAMLDALGAYRKDLDEFVVCMDKRESLMNQGKNYSGDALSSVTALVSNIESSSLENADITISNATSAMVVTIIIILVGIIAAVLLAFYLSNLISKPITKLVEIAGSVARGKLNVNIDTTAKDETGLLAKSFADMIKVINALATEANELGESFREGDIEATLDGARFEGSYKDITESINKIIQGIIGDVLGFMECIGKFGTGDFEADVAPLPGKKAVMNEAVNNMRGNLTSLYKDIASLVQDASNGNLSSRVDVAKYKGDWASLMSELNNLMEAIIAPIDEARTVMENVSEGIFDYKMTGDYRGDFLTIKESINKTVTNISSYIEEISETLGALASDDFDRDITREYVGKFSDIKNALLNIIDKFNTVISSIASASEQVAAGAKIISDSSMTLATGATEQASSVEELNATIHTINENTEQNANDAKDASRLAGDLKSYAVKGNEDMEKMLGSMNGIKESSGRISKIIKVIDDIAFQTNLLALNAAVEAARAGEHGRGFSVVAGEVRSLAGKTQLSARETAELIEEAIDRVNEGTGVANQTDEALKSIVKEAGRVADIIAGISKSSDEQALAIGEVMTGINQITDVVQNNSATAEESASASQELASQSDVLKGMTAVFNLKK